MYLGRRRLITKLDVRPVTETPESAVDYVFKTILRGRVSYDDGVLLLPRAHDELGRRTRVERIAHEVAEEHGRPVIKWMDTPARAFRHLCRYPLNELAQMPIARFWPAPQLGPVQEYAELERSLDLYVLANRLLGVEDHCGELLGARLDFRARLTGASPVPAAVFKARVLAAEIGWIETSLPAVAARAIRAVEDLLSAGYAESSMEICHQLRVFEAFERGLLATWETPKELVCLSARQVA